MIKNLKVNSVDKNIDKLLFHRLVSLLKKEFNFKLESFLINFISSEHLLKINKEFLKHNYYTDIITFNYSKNRLLFDAELYISLQDAQNNANKYHVPLEQELMRLVVHGVLHLLDYDDKSPKTKPVMKKVENRLVNKYKFILNNNRVFYGN